MRRQRVEINKVKKINNDLDIVKYFPQVSVRVIVEFPPGYRHSANNLLAEAHKEAMHKVLSQYAKGEKESSNDKSN